MTNRNLLRTEGKLSTTMERLSSGYKINRAGDNPAGLAISHKMKSQIDGLARAKNNTTDAQSMLRIADSALNETASILQRMRELCVQAANETNSLDERTAIQDEIDNLTKEVDRISTDTEYNTKVLLDGSSDTLVVTSDVTRVDISDQVVPGDYSFTVTEQAEKATFEIAQQPTADGTMCINGIAMDVRADMTPQEFYNALCAAADEAGCTVTPDTPITGPYTIESNEYGSSEAIEIRVTGENKEELAAALGLEAKDQVTDEDGNVLYYSKQEVGKDVKIDLDETREESRTVTRTSPASVTIKRPATSGTFEINGQTVTVTTTMSDADFLAALQTAAAACDCTVTQSGTSYTITTNKLGSAVSLTITSTNFPAMATTARGTDVDVDKTNVPVFSDTCAVYTDGLHVRITDFGGFSMEFLLDEDKNRMGDKSTLEVTNVGAMTIQMGANQYQDMDLRIPETSARTLYLDTIHVKTSAGCDKALMTLDDAIDKLNDTRARIGAFTNRLEYAERSLEETHEDMTSAYSTILDTDMAEAMVEYTQQNVLEQASVSVLSQANDIPQQVLSLLQ